MQRQGLLGRAVADAPAPGPRASRWRTPGPAPAVAGTALRASVAVGAPMLVTTRHPGYSHKPDKTGKHGKTGIRYECSAGVQGHGRSEHPGLAGPRQDRQAVLWGFTWHFCKQ